MESGVRFGPDADGASNNSRSFVSAVGFAMIDNGTVGSFGGGGHSRTAWEAHPDATSANISKHRFFRLTGYLSEFVGILGGYLGEIIGNGLLLLPVQRRYCGIVLCHLGHVGRMGRLTLGNFHGAVAAALVVAEAKQRQRDENPCADPQHSGRDRDHFVSPPLVTSRSATTATPNPRNTAGP